MVIYDCTTTVLPIPTLHLFFLKLVKKRRKHLFSADLSMNCLWHLDKRVVYLDRNKGPIQSEPFLFENGHFSGLPYRRHSFDENGHLKTQLFKNAFRGGNFKKRTVTRCVHGLNTEI